LLAILELETLPSKIVGLLIQGLAGLPERLRAMASRLFFAMIYLDSVLTALLFCHPRVRNL